MPFSHLSRVRLEEPDTLGFNRIQRGPGGGGGGPASYNSGPAMTVGIPANLRIVQRDFPHSATLRYDRPRKKKKEEKEKNPLLPRTSFFTTSTDTRTVVTGHANSPIVFLRPVPRTMPTYRNYESFVKITARSFSFFSPSAASLSPLLRRWRTGGRESRVRSSRAIFRAYARLFFPPGKEPRAAERGMLMPTVVSGSFPPPLPPTAPAGGGFLT